MVVVQFPRHARASASSRRACKAAKRSKVIPLTSRSAASSTMLSQRSPGIDARARQELTVDSGSPKAPATVPVPPSASMQSSTDASMDGTLVRNMRTCQASATCEQPETAGCVQIPAMADSVKVIARRLVALREALDYGGDGGQNSFAEAIGTSRSVYNPFEKGNRRISLDVALKIRERFGVPLDFVYCGDMSRLPREIADRIRVAA